MNKLFIFSSEPPNTSTQFFRAVIAKDRKQAERFVLSPKHSLRGHLKQQLKEDGVYSHCSSIKEALLEYFPFVTEKAIKEGIVLQAVQGQTTY